MEKFSSSFGPKPSSLAPSVVSQLDDSLPAIFGTGKGRDTGGGWGRCINHACLSLTSDKAVINNATHKSQRGTQCPLREEGHEQWEWGEEDYNNASRPTSNNNDKYANQLNTQLRFAVASRYSLIAHLFHIVLLG